MKQVIFGSQPLECCSSENSETITVNRGKRTGKRRLFAKFQHLTGRILLRTGTNTQEGDYHKLDLMFKLGLYRQTEDFLYKNTIYLCTLESQVQHAKSYRRMTGSSYD